MHLEEQISPTVGTTLMHSESAKSGIPYGEKWDFLWGKVGSFGNIWPKFQMALTFDCVGVGSCALDMFNDEYKACFPAIFNPNGQVSWNPL